MSSFAWATKRLLSIRTAFGPPEEDEWSFGQIFPLILSAAPLVSLFDHFPLRSDSLQKYDASSNPSQEEDRSMSENESETNRGLPLHGQESDEGYEFSLSFRTGGLVAAVAYVQLTIYILIIDNISIFEALSQLAFTGFIFYPALLATWIVYDIWMPTLRLSNYLNIVTLDLLFLTVLLLTTLQTALVYGPFPQVVTMEDVETSGRSGLVAFLSPMFSSTTCMCVLLGAYTIFACLILCYAGGNPSSTRTRALARYGVCILTVAVVLGLSVLPFSITYGSPVEPDSRRQFFYGVPVFFAGQIIVLLTEYWIQSTAQTWQTEIRGVILAMVLVIFIAIPWLPHLPYLMPSPYTAVLSLLMTFLVWIIFWICYELGRLCIRWKRKATEIHV